MAKYLKAGTLKSKVIRAGSGFIGNIIGNIIGDITGNMTPPSYTVAQLEDGTTLPADENEGKIVICSDGDAGSLCLARSNGTNWLRIALGAVVDPYPLFWVELADQFGSEIIQSLAELNGKIYGGTDGTGLLLEYSGTAWSQVAAQYLTEHKIECLKVFNEKIYGIGQTGTLLEWNGSDSWVAKGTLSGKISYTLEVHNGKLYVGANDCSLYEWDGVDTLTSVASPYGSETDLWIIKVFKGKLYGVSYPHGYLLEWNDLDAWVLKAGQFGSEEAAYCLQEFEDELYAGTYYGAYLIKWNGVDSWVQVVDGMASGDLEDIRSLGVLNGKLYATDNYNDDLYVFDGVDSLTTKATLPGIPEAWFCKFIIYNGKLYACGTDNGKLYSWG